MTRSKSPASYLYIICIHCQQKKKCSNYKGICGALEILESSPGTGVNGLYFTWILSWSIYPTRRISLSLSLSLPLSIFFPSNPTETFWFICNWGMWESIAPRTVRRSMVHFGWPSKWKVLCWPHTVYCTDRFLFSSWVANGSVQAESRKGNGRSIWAPGVNRKCTIQQQCQRIS